MMIQFIDAYMHRQPWLLQYLSNCIDDEIH